MPRYKTQAEKVHQRLSQDLPINSKTVMVVVDNPLAEILGEKITVLRSIRDDHLARMHAKGFIADHELQAGRKWQFYQEKSQVGCIRALDITKDVVSGGIVRDPVTDSQMAASDKLAAARSELGTYNYYILSDILTGGLTIKQAAERRSMGSKRDELFIGRTFREGLGQLAVLWGISTKPQKNT